MAAIVTSDPQRTASRERVLFVGNSLTSVNDVPGLVAGIARADGRAVHCEVVAINNFSLEDHWQQGDAMRRIAAGGWTTVVLQQGPSALPDSRVLLVQYTRQFDAAIRRQGGRTALYMVWPFASRRFDFDGVSASYRAAAESVGGVILPVGAAWQAVWRRDPAFALYGPDGFHPTPAASYLAALVIYEGLANRTLAVSAALTSQAAHAGLTAADLARVLAGAADVRHQSPAVARDSRSPRR